MTKKEFNALQPGDLIEYSYGAVRCLDVVIAFVTVGMKTYIDVYDVDVGGCDRHSRGFYGNGARMRRDAKVIKAIK